MKKHSCCKEFEEKILETCHEEYKNMKLTFENLKKQIIDTTE